MNEAVEAFFDSEDFPSESDRGFDGSPNNGVQGRAISSTRENPHSHDPLLLWVKRLFLKRGHF
jgi:hypothetical protein